MNNSDLERAIAVLAIEHQVLGPRTAIEVIRAGRLDPDRLLPALLEAVPEQTLLARVAEELGFRFVDLFEPGSPTEVDTDLLGRADVAVCRRLGIIPLRAKTGEALVACTNPLDVEAVEFARRVWGASAEHVLAPSGQIHAKLSLASSDLAAPIEGLTPLDRPDRPERSVNLPTQIGPRSPLVDWVDTVLDTAVAQGASDLHFALDGDGALMLRFRVDGRLRRQPTPVAGREMEVMGILMNRGGLDAANYKEPQGGTFSFQAGGRNIDVRVSMLPQINGPRVVLRLLDSANVKRRLDDMGIGPANLALLREAATSPQGTIIVAGPTGSGKTTTLYALMREVANVEKNTMTVEDPVEYRLDLVDQTQITNLGGGQKALTFPRALREILRQDPDIVLVGEIRDGETAKIAMEAAITGHLVLSTVHAQSALGVYTRLSELGAPSYLVAEALSLSVFQRLVRKIHGCGRSGPPTPEDVELFHKVAADVPERVVHPVGCDGCGGTGFAGRLAIVEVVPSTRRLRELIAARAPMSELEDEARRNGFVPILADGLRLVREERTTISEVLAVVAAGEH